MGRDITYEDVAQSVVDLLLRAETRLPDDVTAALKDAHGHETDPTARAQIEAILENIELAAMRKVPICQDTGILIFFVEIGRDCAINFDIKDAIRDGVKKATEIVPLRPNAVHPTRREPSGNVGIGLPDIILDINEGDRIRITVLPKGAGSENVSRLAMLNPSQVADIKRFVLETVADAGGKPCPPIIVGVGIGGSFDKAARLAKKALLREIRDNASGVDACVNGSAVDACIMGEFEREILDAINSLGIGTMGLGGDITALAVHIEYAHCHTASLPVAVNIQCWANRRASVELGGDGA
ncbi:MAG: fumarate hydratase [Euryarchaeota archaeon]|nr:fumarate hydratase [Euryarchaeota archaeon]